MNVSHKKFCRLIQQWILGQLKGFKVHPAVGWRFELEVGGNFGGELVSPRGEISL